MTPLQFFVDYGFYTGVAIMVGIFLLRFKFYKGPDYSDSFDKKFRELKKWRK